MSDLQREDLRITRFAMGTSRLGTTWIVREVTDAEFDAIAREAGYVKPDDKMTWNEWLSRQAEANGYVPKAWFDACAEESRQRYARIQELEQL